MQQPNYSVICNHSRLKRINDKFVRCLDCGVSMISQNNITSNKSSRDFVKENGSFLRNFDRNFSNVLEEVDEQSSIPTFEYYTDRNFFNLVRINKVVQFYTNPSKYSVTVNNRTEYLTQAQINKILREINAVRIDEYQYNNIYKKLNK